MATVAVIDYGMGNIHSVTKALEKAGSDSSVVVTSRGDELIKADRVVFPGVGALQDCIHTLQELELIRPIRQCLASKPFLGICLGMQALLDSSEENDGTPALGFIPGTVKKFSGNMHDDRTGDMLKIPHMGWNTVRQNVAHPLWRNIPDETRFYFVHSYYVAPQQPEVVAGITEYGEHFASAIFRDNVFAVQFHPEKSQHMGLQLLRNFLGWDGQS